MNRFFIKRVCAVLLFLATLSSSLLAQTQTVRGTLLDRETQRPIGQADLLLSAEGSEGIQRVSSGSDGNFRFAEAAVGRYSLQVSAPGYDLYLAQGLILTAGKEMVLQLELNSSAEVVEAVEIKVKRNSGDAQNEMALISARAFTVEETDRFAGSRGDPARMASNFAGVQGTDDSRNDIVVRGNSPQGILWRLEGIDIPNPNHFAIPGTTGGPVSIINNKMLANSDFFTGAMPAEYGNSLAGAFDLRMRNGNNEKAEFSSQLGFLGWDLNTEAPLGKKGASFIAGYRYSTLNLFSKLNIAVGTDAVPAYQDAFFKVHVPMKDNATLDFFGIGGKSQIDILISDQLESSPNIYGDNDRDQLFGSTMGVIGASYMKPLNNNSYAKFIVSATSQSVRADHQLVFRRITDTLERDGETLFRYAIDSLVPNLDYDFVVSSLQGHFFINKKISNRSVVKYGVQLNQYFYHFHDSGLNYNPAQPDTYWKWSTRWSSDAQSLTAIPYINWKYRLDRRLTLTVGVQAQLTTLYDPQGEAVSGVAGWGYLPVRYTHIAGLKRDKGTPTPLLPRASLRYQFSNKSAFNLGYGLHAQTQSPYVYFYRMPGNMAPHNLGMGLTYSRHLVGGWDYTLKPGSRIKIEAYQQSLNGIPVEVQSSSFSLANSGSGFSRFFPDTLQNTGLGRNMGAELTIERFFNAGYYYLLSASVFDAKYQGSDGVWRNTDFNTDYAANALFAKEWVFGNGNSLNVGGKLTMAGARRYSPMDTLASQNAREFIEVDALKNTERFGNPYRRFDVRIAYRIEAKKVSHEIAIDLVNATNRQNILKYSYINEAPYIKTDYQLGLLPLFYYKVNW